jgi:hypothetical protein
MGLTLPARTKQEIMDRLDDLPRPKRLAGKVVVCLEFNCRPDGTIGSVNYEASVREELSRPS